MHEVQATRTIDAPTAAVWEVLDDFAGVSKFNPAVDSAHLVAGPDTGEGATRECVLADGGTISERIIEYEPGTSLTIEFIDLGEMDAVIEEFVTTWSVAALADDRSRVTLEGAYRPRYGPIGWLGARLVMNSMYEDLYEETLEGLAEYAEESELAAN